MKLNDFFSIEKDSLSQPKANLTIKNNSLTPFKGNMRNFSKVVSVQKDKDKSGSIKVSAQFNNTSVNRIKMPKTSPTSPIPDISITLNNED